MVAGKASGGGSIGSVGGAARGSTGIASRGGGKESFGGFSGGRSFGNTARFESSFSGRSLATVSRPHHGETRGVPSFSIGKSGSLERHTPSPVRTVDRPKTTGRPTARHAFGPQIEAVRSQSHDTYRPGVSHLRDMKSIYESTADARYHAQPGHSRFHTEPGRNNEPRTVNKNPSVRHEAARPHVHEAKVTKPATRSFGPRLEAVRTPSPDTHQPTALLTKNTAILFSRNEATPKTERTVAPKVSPRTFGPKLEAVRAPSQDTNRPQVSPIRDTVPMYQRPDAKTHTPESKQQGMPKERHSLSPKTQELKVRSERSATLPQPTLQDSSRSMYERSQTKIDPQREHIAIAPSGQSKVITGKIDGSARWQQALAKKSAAVGQIHTAGGRGVDVTNRGRQVDARSRTLSEGYKTLQKKVETATPVRSDLLSTTEPLKVTSSTHLDRTVREELDHPRQIVRPEIAQARGGTLEPVPAQSSAPTLTHAETQKVLDRYLARTREQQGIAAARAPRTHVSVDALPSQEVRADIEQAARVMQAYKNVLSTGAYTGITVVQAEQAVLKALDQKLEQRQLKGTIAAIAVAPARQLDVSPAGLRNAVLTETQISSVRQELQAGEVTDTVDPQIVALLEQLQIDPELIPATELRRLTGMQTVTEAQPVVEAAVIEATDEQVSHSVTTSHAPAVPPIGAAQLLEEEQGEETGEEEEDLQQLEAEEQLDQLEKELTFERDEIKNTIRISVVVYISVFLRYIRREEVIQGSMIAEQMVRVYDPLVSDIVPEGRPDDNLTALIEAIAEKEYTSVADVVEDVTALADKYTAITIGDTNNITTEEAARLRYSTKYPTIPSHRTNTERGAAIKGAYN